MNVTTNLLWEVLARALPYRETWRRRIKRQQPVNVSELQSFLVEARRVANSTPSRRYLAGADSQVALGAVVKGARCSTEAQHHDADYTSLCAGWRHLQLADVLLHFIP